MLQLAAAAGALLALLLAGIYVKWTTFDHRLVTITPGTIYQSAAIEPQELVAICEERGIRTVIDLRDGEPDKTDSERRAAAAAGLEFVHLPTSCHPESCAVDAFLAAMETAERPVLVHCEHGEGRSVLMCAIHRIVNEGWTNQGAFEGTTRLPQSLRFLSHWIPILCRFRADTPKGRFVLGYERTRHAASNH